MFSVNTNNIEYIYLEAIVRRLRISIPHRILTIYCIFHAIAGQKSLEYLLFEARQTNNNLLIRPIDNVVGQN